MTFDSLTSIELHTAVGGLIAAIVGLYCARQEHKRSHPSEETPQIKAAAVR